ncbi:MAG: DUF2330 domain-containing protein [Polyangiaceae bacterium]|nr:DUF2330 domain-containing protein [Polyangiaceae bacterium]
MKLSSLLMCLLPLVAAPAFVTTDARACGGCLVSETETTQVTSHRMILSVSKDRTVLWDQITYSGEPESFAWVLPIKGTVDVGLSSDAMFASLEQATSVTVSSPVINCLPPECAFGPPNADGSGASSSAGGGGGVTVIAEEVVGPYATVQLSSQDPNALKTWLLGNGYNLPLDISPIVDAYVKEGFNFLALKLVPGVGINSMRPVRVTSAGATPVLPLRMVAAGTGQTTPITLWVMGEGRYEPSNFDSFTIDAEKLVWNWDTSSSNYAQIKQDEFAASGGKSWLVEAAEQFSRYWLEEGLRWAAEFDPKNSGYGGDPMGPSALEECNADLDALFGGIPDNTLWVTRLHAELSRAALVTDLNLQASANQIPVNRWLQVTNSVGTPPACPPPPDWCTNPGGVPPVDTNPWDNHFGSGNGSTSQASASCAIATESSVPAAVALMSSALVLSFARKRSRRSRVARSS